MARMIPPFADRDCLSPGERILFGRFREDPQTTNWTVLHSLGISEHGTRLAGEIDFVAIIPREGVLCLEVKGGSVSRKDGVWRYGDGSRLVDSSVGPFRQASDAMHAIRRYVTHKEPSLGRLLFWSGVFFTLIDFHEESPEWQPWQFADRSMLSRHPVSRCCLRILRAAHAFVRSTPSCKWYDPEKSRPTQEQAECLAELLRPDFEYMESQGASIEAAERTICTFTEEQFTALDLLPENKRVMFKGPAGTGKTLLALETAKRFALEGRRTFLGCYNRLLGEWLRREVGTFGKQVKLHLTASTYHRLLLDLSGLGPQQEQDAVFWSRSLPSIVVDRALSDVIQVPQFEAVVLDEAQDLITDGYLDVLDLLLEGGLAGSRWAMFGDFERQALYTRGSEEPATGLLELLRNRSTEFAVFPLRVNCRNTGQIAAAVEIACGLVPGYSRVVHDLEGPDVEVAFYADDLTQTDMLRQWLHQLMTRHSPTHIMVLSPRRDEDACAGKLGPKASALRLRTLRGASQDERDIRFATIHAFKGLEASAAVLTDIEHIDDDMARALLYVGMSRARIELVILMHERCRQHWLDALQQGLTAHLRTRRTRDGVA